jgi:hypothetical protein
LLLTASRNPVADRPHSAVLRSDRDRVEGRGIGTAIHHLPKPDLDRRTFESSRAEVIEDHGT